MPSLQVYELLHDLQTAFQNGQEYFLGALVTTKPEDGGVCSAYQVRRDQLRAASVLGASGQRLHDHQWRPAECRHGHLHGLARACGAALDPCPGRHALARDRSSMGSSD